ncbi:MAG TPA: ABC transporter permease [Luteitalea sp.]|nr:ABC transporter permease [Luteitalea sp.]
MLGDLRFAVRSLLRHAGTTTVAVLSLALGMMATTAIYSVVHAVVLDPFPYRDVDRLMSVRVASPGQPFGRTGYSVDQFLEIAERNTIFEGVIASTISDVLWMDGTQPHRLRGNHGTANTFEVMGVPALVGRTFTPGDVEGTASPVVVLGYRFWHTRFAGDPNVVGRTLRLDGTERTVVGVMPKRFMWRGADVYVPVAFRRDAANEGVRGVHLLGRLKPNITDAHAESDLTPIIADLKRMYPSEFPDTWRVGLLSFAETFPSSIRRNLWTLFGAVGLLLLIACANVSNLLLARAAERRPEIALRTAIGASRWRVIRPLLLESLVIAVAAALLGTLLAAGSLRALLGLVPPGTIPDESEIALNIPVLLFTGAIGVLTTMVFGLLPAIHATTPSLASPLRESGRTVGGNRRQALLRKGLVVGEIALSFMLLMAAGLMIRTFFSLQDVALGFETSRVLTMRVPLPERRYPTREHRVRFFQDLLQRLEATPGVIAVGVNTFPHPFGNMSTEVEVLGARIASPAPVLVHQTSAGYTAAFGIGVLQGRMFDASEVERRLPVAVVNETFVRLRVDDGLPIGKVVRIPELTEPPANVEFSEVTIVGVVRNTVNRGIDDPIGPEIYLPYTLAGMADRIVMATRGDPTLVMKPAVAQVVAIDAEQPAVDMRTIEHMLQEGSYAGPRFNLVLFTAFAGLGLTLAMIGVFGVMSSAVAQQQHEVGVRMAVGASPGEVLRMVVGRGAWLIAAGLVTGLAGAVLSVRLLQSFLAQVSPFDPLTMVSVCALVAIVGLLACFWPARRASRFNPIALLRHQ